MDSPARRKYVRSLFKAYDESNKEIEDSRLKQVIKTINKYEGRVALQTVSNCTMLNPKTIAGLIRRHSYCFKCFVHPDKRDDFTASDVKIELTNEGKKML